MTFNTEIYFQIRKILYNKYSYPIEQIQPHIRFQIELAIDSLEMYELINEIEEVFNIRIDLDDIDNFIFQPQTIHHISDIKYLTIIDVVDYVDKQIQMRDQVIK